ncbi:MAG: hypothetical protein WCL14_08055 [Bacteroidota bacterium]
MNFEATCRQILAPIVAAARCFVSVVGMQRLQRIAGRTLIREAAIGFKKEWKWIKQFLFLYLCGLKK